MRGPAIAPFAFSVLTLVAATLALAFGMLNYGPQQNARSASLARRLAADVDRRIADAVMLRQIFLVTGETLYAQRADVAFDQLPRRIEDLSAIALPVAAPEARAALQTGAQAAHALAGAEIDDEAWRDDGALGDLRRASADWSGAIEQALVDARARADASAARLSVMVFVLVALALMLTLAQGRDVWRMLSKGARERAEALSRAEALDRDLAESRLNLEVVNERLELALSTAGVLVFSQDADLRYEWVSRGEFGRSAEEFIGLDDADLFGADAARKAVEAKREALTHGRLVRAELSVVDRGSPRWIELHVGPVRASQAGGPSGGLLGAMIDITQRRLDRESNAWLMRELSHRTQNLLAIVQSMARHTARTSISGRQFIVRFRDRLTALSAAHYLLVRASFHGVDLEELVRSQLLEADRLIGGRVRLSGPAVSLRPDAAQNLAMALSELASNAVTHGALSASDGEVEVSWSVEAASGGARLKLLWAERPAQARAQAGAPGFGSVIVTRMAPRSLNARVKLDHRPEGTRCEIDMPMSVVAVGPESCPQAPANTSPAST